jgi:hypothetical protein
MQGDKVSDLQLWRIGPYGDDCVNVASASTRRQLKHFAFQSSQFAPRISALSRNRLASTKHEQERFVDAIFFRLWLALITTWVA